MTTFDIIKDIRALESLMNEIDEETGEFINGEDDLKSFIVELKIHKELKLDNIQDLKIEYSHKVEALKEKIDILSKRKKHFESQVNKLEDLQLLLLDGQKCETDNYKFTFRKSESVDVLDVEALPLDCVRIKKEADKTTIKKRLKDGELINGCSLVEKQNLQVK